MGLYDGIKDVAKVVQQADNIDLYKKLIDLSAQALEMQEEISRLKQEINSLKQTETLENDIEYHEGAFITRKSDKELVKYCASCWADRKVLMPLKRSIVYGSYQCALCEKDRIG